MSVSSRMQLIDPNCIERRLDDMGSFQGFQLKAPQDRPSGFRSPNLDRIRRVWVSRVYIVLEYEICSDFDGRDFRTLGIRRKNEREIRESWSEVARIVREIMGDQVWGVEMYPPAACLVDQAPMRWIWVFEEEPLPIGLHREFTVGDYVASKRTVS